MFPTGLKPWIDDFAAEPRHRTGVQAFRVMTGFVLLYQILINYEQRHLLYGPEGAYPFALFAEGFGQTHISPLALTDSPLAFEMIYGLCIVVFALWTLGKWTWITTPLTWFAAHTLHERCHGLWDGGDNLIRLVLLYAILMNLSPLGARVRPLARVPLERIRNVLHNVGLIACTVQVCLVYFVAGVSKVPGKYWQNGTSFYYVLRSLEFGVTPFGPLIWENAYVLAFCSWAPVLLQLAFPWVYGFGRPLPRRLIVAAAMSFHAGIFVLMGLESFALFMIAAELLLLSDADYVWFGDRLQTVRAVAGSCGARLQRLLGRRVQAPGGDQA